MIQTLTRPLAILGGTFDPIHLGHLCAAWEAAELLDAEVRLMPVNRPPHRCAPHASSEQRVAMLQAVLHRQQRLMLDTRELKRQGPSYTVDTLRELRAEQARRPLVLLLGTDAFAGLPSWHHWEDLFELAHMGVLSRPGVADDWPVELARQVDSRRTKDVKMLWARPAGHVIELMVTSLEISATRIRDLFAAGREPRYLLPEALFADPALLQPYRNK